MKNIKQNFSQNSQNETEIFHHMQSQKNSDGPIMVKQSIIYFKLECPTLTQKSRICNLRLMLKLQQDRMRFMM